MIQEDEPSPASLLIDTTCLFDQYARRGIGRYTRDILRRFIKIAQQDTRLEIALIGFYDLHKNLIELGFSQFGIEEIKQHLTFFSLGEPVVSNPGNVRRWKQFEEIIFQYDPSAYWAMHFERGLPSHPRLKNRLSDIKTIVTVHDIIPRVTNKFSNRGTVANFLKKRFFNFMWKGVEHADLVLTPSNFSKKDLMKYGHISEDHIQRIYLGINEPFFKHAEVFTEQEKQEIVERYGLTEIPYLFYDSGIESNKGIKNLLPILSLFFGKQPRPDLPQKFVITGGDFYKGVGEAIRPRSPLGEKVLQDIKQQGILPFFVTTGRIEDEELIMLLSQAQGYLYLSEYEGFGFGPVQAMAAGVPSIVNNASCLPEITQNGALHVDAQYHQKTAKMMKDFLRDAKEREKTVAQGHEVAKQYNWEETAQKTYDAIIYLINNKEANVSST